MFRFLNEINEEIAREENLLKAMPNINSDHKLDRGYLLLRGPKGNKMLVNQRRYIDNTGCRKSEEVVIGAVDSETVANYIGQEYNTELSKRLNDNLKNLKNFSAKFKPFDVDAIINSLPELSKRIIAMAPSNIIFDNIFNLSKGQSIANGQNAMSERDRENVCSSAAGNAAARSSVAGNATARSSVAGTAAELSSAAGNAMSRSSTENNSAARRVQVNNKTYLNAPGITASDGLQVRSKSEAIICNLLNQHSIEYAYERRLELKDENGFKTVRVPDFTIKTRKGIVIWEHLGLLDNDEYFETNASKLRLYWMNGFVLNETLIVTVDERGGGINARTIDAIIKNCLVPYVI